MKNLKKVFAIVLTVAMLVTLFMVPVVAVEKTDAEKLETLGILVGAGDGVTEAYLASPATRITSAILLLKLKGVIADAEAWNGTVNFNDADDALSLYAKSIMGYLKNNPAMGFVGDGMGNFNPNAVITPQEYYKVLLVALGYAQGVDFEWADVMDFAASLGLDAIADVDGLTIEDFATATVEALNTEVKGTGMTLIEKLVADGVVDEEDAEEAGWVITPELAIDSAAQVGKNKIEVKFTTAVDTSAATVAFKQGLVFYYATVAWNEAKDTATLTTAVNPIPAGTYTVEVSGVGDVMTANVTVVAPVAATVEIKTAILYNGSTSFAFAVKNQFGEDMGIASGSVFATAFKTAAGTGGTVGNLPLTAGADSTFTFSAANTVVGDVVQITVVYGALAPATKSFTVQADPAASTIAFGTVSPLANKSYIFVTDAGLEIPYALYDQYGVATKLPAHAANADTVADQETIGGILFITSNAAIVDPDTFVVDSNGKLTFTAGATAGTAVVTAVWNANIVGQISITVTAAPTASVASIAAPTILVAGGDPAFNLGLTLLDQFGGAVTSNAGLTITAKSGTDPFGTVEFVGATAVKYTPPSSVATTKSVTIDIMNGAVKIGTLTFNVQPDAVETSLTGVTFTTTFQAGAELMVDRNQVTVLDQYGRAFAGGSVTVTDGAGAAFTVSGTTIQAVSTGSDVIGVKVGATNTYQVAVTCVADTAITQYALAVTPSTIYVSANSAYFGTPKLTGQTAGGQAVVLKAGLPTSVTSSNSAIAAINAGKVQGIDAGSATIYAWNGATLLASATVTTTKAAPVAQTITFTAATVELGADLSTILKITDQYGVNIAAPGVYAVASDNTAVINAAGQTLAAGTVKVTVVKDGVMSAMTEVTVDDTVDPEVLTAVFTSGTQMTITFTETLDFANGATVTGFSLNGPATVNWVYVAATNTVVGTRTSGTWITTVGAYTLTYAGGNVQDLAGNDLPDDVWTGLTYTPPV